MRSRRALPAIVVLLGSLVLTGTLAVVAATLVTSRDQARFEHSVHSTVDRIRNRMELYIAMMRGACGLFDAIGPRAVTAQQFHTYVERLAISTHYPGIQGVGFSRRLPTAQREAFTAALQELHGPGFRLWPEVSGDTLDAIIYLEPLDRRNRAALGFNMGVEPSRRAAMEQARATGEAAMTRRVTLVQEIEPVKQSGFLIYLPVYQPRAPGAAPAQPPRAAAELVGFVYSPFRSADLLAGIFDSETRPDVAFRLHDAPPAGDGQSCSGDLIDEWPGARPAEGPGPPQKDGGAQAAAAAARPPPRDAWTPPRDFRAVRALSLAGRTLCLRFTPLPAFEQKSERPVVAVILIVGALVSAVLALGSRAQSHARFLAERSAAELSISQARLREESQRNAALYQEAQEAVQARDEFLSIASHELRTPLSTLQLRLDSLQRRIARGADPAELLEHLQPAGRQLLRFSHLIDEMLDVSRISEGRLRLDPEEMDLGALVAETAERLAPQAKRSGSDLLVQVEEARGRWDRTRLEQVVANLLTNALTYGAGKPVSLTVRARPGGGELVVTDQGIGIAPEDQSRLFGRFERLVSHRDFGGFGLGLWICRQIVEAHGGTITVASQVGAGARFTVVLPAEPPPQKGG